jgi:DNA-binding transcriptional ArsR family regulator
MVQLNQRPVGTLPPEERAASNGEARSCCGSGLQAFLSPRLFKALADPRRLALLVRMADERRSCTVGQLAEGSGVDLSVVSRHLAILREAGVIRCVKQGREVRCTVPTGAVARILRDLADALETCCPAGEAGDGVAVAAGHRPGPASSPAGP